MNIKRQPRPINYTSLCTSYQKALSESRNPIPPSTPTQTEKSPNKKYLKYKLQLTKYITSIYLSNNLSIYILSANKERSLLGLGDVARVINVKEEYLAKVMNKELEDNQELIGLGLKIESRAAINGLFFGALKDRQWAENLTQEIYNQALTARYPAPLFQQTNTAFANQMAANNHLLSILTKLPGLINPQPNPNHNGTSINILNQNGGLNGPTTDNQFLTTNMAISLLKDSGLKQVSPEALYLTEGLAEIEEVTANVSDAQGRNNLNPKDLIYTKNHTGHEDRRQQEYQIVEPG